MCGIYRLDLAGHRKLVTCKHCLRLLKKADAGIKSASTETQDMEMLRYFVCCCGCSLDTKCLETLVLGGEFRKEN